jgi:acyl-CoA reductase-like NAD-dependent aldehyde dehydrogenase
MIFSNLLRGKLSQEGKRFDVFSPIDQKVIGQGITISSGEIDRVFERLHQSFKNSSKDREAIDFKKLAAYINSRKKSFVDQIILETGYTLKDATDLVEGSIEFLSYFEDHINEVNNPIQVATFSFNVKTGRRLCVYSKPYGVIAAMTAQNAPLLLELTVIANALVGGNSIILRPSSQCVGTISLLSRALVKTLPTSILEKINIVSCNAIDFLESSHKKANLIHYIGSSRHGLNILRESIESNVKVLVDGEGSSFVVVGKNIPLDSVIKACRDGIVRCNGELCSSIRMILVPKENYEEFSGKLAEALNSLSIGDPRLNNNNMGPLFHEKQAEGLLEIAKKYKIISGKSEKLPLGKNYIAPVLCALGSRDGKFLEEDVYGPIAGIMPYEKDEWKKWLGKSPCNLNDALFSNDKKMQEEFIRESKASRIIINHDPSIESVFEPWGGFLPSGFNDVSFWANKYRQSIQVDTDS